MNDRNNTTVAGRPRTRAHEPHPLPLATAADVMQRCAEAFNEYSNGKISEDQARCRGYLLQVAAAALKNCVFEQRLAEIEKQLARVEGERAIR